MAAVERPEPSRLGAGQIPVRYSQKFQQIDRYVNERLVRLIYRHRRRWGRPFHDPWWTPARFTTLRLHRLVGRIRYPAQVKAT